MTDRTTFEAQLEARLVAHAGVVDRPIDSALITATAAASGRHAGPPWALPRIGRSGSRLVGPAVVWLALVALLIAMVAVGLLAGGRPDFPAVVQASVGPSSSPGASASAIPILPGEPWIVYMSSVGAADSDRLFLVRSDGTGRHELKTGLDGQQEHPDWSPDGSTIVLERWLTDATYPQHDRLELWTVRPDGSEVTRIVDCALPCLQVSAPAWSPDGRSIAFVRYDLVSAEVWGPTSLVVLDVATGGQRTVIATPDGSTAYYHPRWSPDGSQIVFGLETYQDASETVLTSAEIAFVKADGTETQPRYVATGGRDAWAPDWHPTDDLILFHTRFDPADPVDRTVPTDIWVARSDSSLLRNLSDLGLSDLRAIDPTWTPDGSRIVFTQVDGFQGSQIPAVALMDADGTGAARIGFSDGTVGRLRPTP